VDERSYDFNQGWLFGGRYRAGAAEPGYDDSGFTPVTLPHTVTALSWGGWDPASWQQVWIYRKHFGWPGGAGQPGGASGARSRVFVDFDGVLVSAAVLVNGRPAGRHQGGYLPWSAELTGSLAEGGNVLAVIVDARWLPVPPDGAAAGAAAVDFLQPGGIYRDVRLRVVPELFLSGVSAWPACVLTADRAVDVEATVDAATAPAGPARITAELGGRPGPRHHHGHRPGRRPGGGQAAAHRPARGRALVAGHPPALHHPHDAVGR
jgi:beta-galactosidase